MSWWILALMTLDYALGMIDRNTVSILKTQLKDVFGVGDADYGVLVTAFMVPYALCYVLCGLLVDRIGTRAALTLFVSVWSAATIAAGLSSSWGELVFWRIVLGAAEAGLLPTTIVALVNWFPRDKLATAYAVKTPLQSLGPILSPPLIAGLALAYGWRSAFVIPGAVGLAFAALWWFSDRNAPYAEPKRSEAPAERIGVATLLRNRVFLAIVSARLISDPVWFFFQYWQAGYLQERLGLSLADVGRLLWIPPAVNALLTFATALWSDRLIAQGRSASHSRLVVLGVTTVLSPLLFVLPVTSAVPVVLAVLTTTYFMAFTWLYLTNLLTADLFPKKVVGLAIGVIGTVGTVGAAAFNWIAGYLIESVGYTPLFVVCGMLHPLALLLLWWVIRGHTRVTAT